MEDIMGGLEACKMRRRGAAPAALVVVLVAAAVALLGDGGMLVQGRRLTPAMMEQRRNERQQTAEPAVVAEREPRRAMKEVLSDPSRPEEHLVDGLPGLERGAFSPKMYAGLLSVHETAPGRADGNMVPGKLFYWLVDAASHAAAKPLIVWLNGGPGCSSMDGFFLENGPLRLGKDDVISVNPHGWHHAANVLYIDQPVGTGYSFTTSDAGHASNDADVNRDLYVFMQNFLKLHSRFVVEDDGAGAGRSVPIIFTGESHAGHYIPTFLKFALEQNEGLNADSSYVQLNITSAAIGNGWTDPYHQYDVSEKAHGLGLISHEQLATMKQVEHTCQGDLDRRHLKSSTCWSLLDRVVADASVSKNKLNVYDTREFVRSAGSFPPGHVVMEKYLNRGTVKAALHATESPLTFEECADPPYNHLSHQDGKGVLPELTWLLDRGIPILYYSGQADLICQHIGTEKMLHLLDWEHAAHYRSARSAIWEVDGHPAGYYKASHNLAFLLVLDAGHMVPMDQPKRALDMISRFVDDRSFHDSSTRIASKVVPWGAATDTGCDLSAVECPLLPGPASPVENDNGDAVGTTPSRTSTPATTPATPTKPSVPLPYFTRDPVPVEHNALAVHFALGDPDGDGDESTHDAGAIEVVATIADQAVARGNTSPLILTGLQPGVPVAVTLVSQDGRGARSPTSDVRVATPGCVHEKHEQCCGRGFCVAVPAAADTNERATTTASSSTGTAKCVCAHGYTGDSCNEHTNDDASATTGAMETDLCPERSNADDTRLHHHAGETESADLTCNHDKHAGPCGASIHFEIFVPEWIVSRQEVKQYKEDLKSTKLKTMSMSMQGGMDGDDGCSSPFDVIAELIARDFEHAFNTQYTVQATVTPSDGVFDVELPTAPPPSGGHMDMPMPSGSRQRDREHRALDTTQRAEKSSKKERHTRLLVYVQFPALPWMEAEHRTRLLYPEAGVSATTASNKNVIVLPADLKEEFLRETRESNMAVRTQVQEQFADPASALRTGFVTTWIRLTGDRQYVFSTYVEPVVHQETRAEQTNNAFNVVASVIGLGIVFCCVTFCGRNVSSVTADFADDMRQRRMRHAQSSRNNGESGLELKPMDVA